MSFSTITPGKKTTEAVNVIIEIPAQHAAIKYEVDKEQDCLMVDRFLSTPMFYPANYGYIPETLAEDGDPLDALVICPTPVAPGAVVYSRPIGIFHMQDENGPDDKVICVPHSSLTPRYDGIEEVSQLPGTLRDQVEHFFSHYKDLEPGKWVTTAGWGTQAEAIELIKSSLTAYSSH